ncbi:MFS transporter [Streptomyces hirsutus]
MAGWTGTRPAFWTGGLACVASVGLLAAVLPKLLTYDALTDEDALRRRAAHTAATGGPGQAGAVEKADT